jgi:hypothetical protein
MAATLRVIDLATISVALSSSLRQPIKISTLFIPEGVNRVGRLSFPVKQRLHVCMDSSTRRVKVECFHPHDGGTGQAGGIVRVGALLFLLAAVLF